MTSVADGQVVGTPSSFPDAVTAAELALDAGAELAAAELATAGLAAAVLAAGTAGALELGTLAVGAAAVVADGDVEVLALVLAPAELLLLLHPLIPKAAPARQAQATAR